MTSLLNKENLKYLDLPDIVNLLFLLFLTAVNIIFSSVLPDWYLFSLANTAVSFLIIIIVVKYESAPIEKKLNDKFSLLKIIRFWYPMLLILFVFKEIYVLVRPINPNDIDLALIKIDFWMFGVNPTQWTFQFANPLLTEFLQIIYGLYYLVIPAYGIEVFLKKRYKDFNYSVFVLFTGFYLAYILYLIFPAVGPRFHLHEFYSIHGELPGLFLTEPIRTFLNFGESIAAGVTNPQDYVQRDAMPSLHAEVAILLAYLAKKLKLKSFSFYLPYCILMLISTVYLRYHYVIDLIAGAMLALIPILIGKLMYQAKDGEFIPKTNS
jgi:membrane-associated phospholipid phosphatase